MSLKPFFSASSKVWEDRRWVYSLPEIGYEGWEVMADGSSTLEKKENVREVAEIAASQGALGRAETKLKRAESELRAAARDQVVGVAGVDDHVVHRRR